MFERIARNVLEFGCGDQTFFLGGSRQEEQQAASKPIRSGRRYHEVRLSINVEVVMLEALASRRHGKIL